jgi:uncharacterized protein with ATP-grasp and redox domains
MPQLPPLERVCDIHTSTDPLLEAWMYHFLLENNIEYLLNPSIVASPEQMRFMVALEEDQVYLPCDDALFFLIYRGQGAELSEEYLKVWRFVSSLVQTYNMSPAESSRILGLCRYRFDLFFSERLVLPSRMIKRLLSIVLSQCGDMDPFREKKIRRNERGAKFLENPEFIALLEACPEFDQACISIPIMRWELYLEEMSRLLALSTLRDIWEGVVTPESIRQVIVDEAPECACLRQVFGEENSPRKKVLYIPDVAGAFMLDLAIIKSLLRQGHKVVLALKDAFYFDSPVIWDMEADPRLKTALESAHVNTSDNLSKNQLLQELRENRFLVISDGLAEQLNLYRASVTFARAWKECDVVIAKGRRNQALFLGSSHEFTRDILCAWRGDQGDFHLELKPRAEGVRQFPEQEILAHAKKIVAEMRKAREAGTTVMFYSAIIGSIPGQTRVAIQLVNAFADDLRSRLDNTLIINPAEHFEEGMDGDDLMFMWEFVQRSGLLDVWRFQTVEDIEKSFALLGRKVPAIWSGKDSTFSTGCTKEMRIALDMQKLHPEMQIIGPSAEKFFRRRDYGVGKYFDATIKS